MGKTHLRYFCSFSQCEWVRIISLRLRKYQTTITLSLTVASCKPHSVEFIRKIVRTHHLAWFTGLCLAFLESRASVSVDEKCISIWLDLLIHDMDSLFHKVSLSYSAEALFTNQERRIPDTSAHGFLARRTQNQMHSASCI